MVKGLVFSLVLKDSLLTISIMFVINAVTNVVNVVVISTANNAQDVELLALI